MPNTYTLIASNTLSSSAASVTFSAIPNTYTDLVLRISVRNTGGTFPNISLRPNNSTSAIYSGTWFYGYGSSIFNSRTSSNDAASLGYHNGSGTTSNTFSNLEVYIPSYTASQNKPFSSFNVAENNSSTDNSIYVRAHLFSDTTAISSLVIYTTTDSFASTSSFFLYGIKNS